MTRTPATAVMKFVSPDHRGRTCMCMCDGIPAPAARLNRLERASYKNGNE